MIYDNSDVRRRDRLLDESRALEILRNGEYGVLSMSGTDGTGYGIPLNYVYGESRIYIHCAPEGEKLRRIETNPNVTFCVVGRTAVLPGKFSTGYESITASGRATLVTVDTERMEALKLILKKYSPDFYETGVKYARASFGRTAIIRLEIRRLSGKTRPEGLNRV